MWTASQCVAGSIVLQTPIKGHIVYMATVQTLCTHQHGWVDLCCDAGYASTVTLMK